MALERGSGKFLFLKQKEGHRRYSQSHDQPDPASETSAGEALPDKRISQIEEEQ